MRIGSVSNRILAGLLVGSICSLAVSAVGGHPLTLSVSVPNAYACTFVGSEFTGFLYNHSNAGSIQGNITGPNGVSACGEGPSYWVMVVSPSLKGYAQDGWLDLQWGYPIGSGGGEQWWGTPHDFAEVADNSGNDPGPYVYGASGTPSGGHLYKTVVGAYAQGYAASFYVDGNAIDSLGIDWDHGGGFQTSSEVHSVPSTLGTTYFDSLSYCIQSSQGAPCSPNTAYNVGQYENMATCYPNGQYVPWWFGNNSFYVKDGSESVC